MTTEPVIETKAQEDADIEAMLAAVPPAPEPGTVAPRDIVSRGDAEVPAPMIVRSVESAGYVTLYDTKTGEPCSVNGNMAREVLRRRRPDGTRKFDTRDPGFRPPKGKLLCWLHPDDPLRKEWDRMGLPVCEAAGLPNEHQRDLHMRHRHKTSWETIKSIRDREEREEERTFRRELLGKAVKAPHSYVQESIIPPRHPEKEIAASKKPDCACGYVIKPDSKNPPGSLRAHQTIWCPLRVKKVKVDAQEAVDQQGDQEARAASS